MIAKPAEQTPLIAAEAVKILWQAGIPKSVVQLLPGRGEIVGSQLSQDDRIHAVMFTGSTEVAKILQRTLAKRLSPQGCPIPLIAETGGQNAMIVDSSALTEQVVLDAVNSAFDSAGQRCSALRVLCVQQDNAPTLIKMLKGAMQQLNCGNPQQLDIDVGPVIDLDAQQNIENHIEQMRQKGYPVHQLQFKTSQDKYDHSYKTQGTFVSPTLIELPNLNELKREVFGPVLHVITYKYGELEKLLQHINDKGYGLTMGLHTRIDETIDTVIQHAEVGNLYINRNIVGAVVGVQPFGGEGLSGTGPKAGGPIYMHKLMQHQSYKQNQLFGTIKSLTTKTKLAQFVAFKTWAMQQFKIDLNLSIEENLIGLYTLPGPTGESNHYTIVPRKTVLCMAEQEQSLIQQLTSVYAIGSTPVVLHDDVVILKYLSSMPETLRKSIQIIQNIETDHFDAVLYQGSEQKLMRLQQSIAQRQGAIIGITHVQIGQSIPIDRLVIERAVSINTAAAGGNASLMTLQS